MDLPHIDVDRASLDQEKFMNRLESFKPAVWAMAAITAAVMAGCGGGGDDAPPTPAAPPAAAVGQITGTWAVVEDSVVASDPLCEPASNPLASYNLAILQTGDDVTVEDGTNPSSPTAPFAGSLHGTKLTWAGSFPERGGVTTFNTVDLTVDPATCGSFTGTQTWTYVQDAPATFSCTGTTTLHATDQSGTDCTL
jgi:hypothetical protein